MESLFNSFMKTTDVCGRKEKKQRQNFLKYVK